MVNLILENIRVKDVKQIEVKLGEKFTIKTETPTPKARWFSESDDVLGVKEKGDEIKVVALSTGKSEIQLQVNGSIVAKVQVKVFATPMTYLKFIFSKPELK
jgi:hypothetical protein